MSVKMLGSNVTMMTAEGGSITGVPVSAGCQALETVHIPLLLRFRAPMQLNVICNHRLQWLLAVLLSVSEMLRVVLASLQSAGDLERNYWKHARRASGRKPLLS